MESQRIFHQDTQTPLVSHTHMDLLLLLHSIHTQMPPCSHSLRVVPEDLLSLSPATGNKGHHHHHHHLAIPSISILLTLGVVQFDSSQKEVGPEGNSQMEGGQGGISLKERHPEGNFPKKVSTKGNSPNNPAPGLIFLKKEDLGGSFPKEGDLEGSFPKEGDLGGSFPKEGDLEGSFPKEGDLEGSFLKEGDLGGSFLMEGGLEGSFLKEGDLGEAISLSLVEIRALVLNVPCQWTILTTHTLATDQQCHSQKEDMVGLTSHLMGTKADQWITARGPFLTAGLLEEEVIFHLVIRGRLSTARIIILEIVSSPKEGQGDQTSSHPEEKRGHTLVTIPASVRTLVRDSSRKGYLVEGLDSLHLSETRVCPEVISNTASTHPTLEMVVVVVSIPKVAGLEDRISPLRGEKGNQDTGSKTNRFPPTNHHHQDGSTIDRNLMDNTLIRKVFIPVQATSVSFAQKDATSTQTDQDLLSMDSTRYHLDSSNLCVTHG